MYALCLHMYEGTLFEKPYDKQETSDLSYKYR